MGILHFFVICLVIGFVIWLIQTYAPIPQQVKTIVLWAGILVLLLILLNAMGILGMDYPIPRIR